MRRVLILSSILLCGIGWSSSATAQTDDRPVIQTVTVREDTGVVVIAGSGFGEEPAVIISGIRIPLLPDHSDTHLSVVLPAALLQTPGTLRLTVIDPVRQVGDGFVLAIRGAVVPGVGVGDVNQAAAESQAVKGGSGMATAVPTSAAKTSAKAGTPAPLSFENPGPSYNTGIGYQVLANNTTGIANTASGYEALIANTAGSFNTASGHLALASNTTGDHNTATGVGALYGNTSGSDNTAVGLSVLGSNSTGTNNAAIGKEALASSTTGSFNTASGSQALFSNTTGDENTASGGQALHSNTTGYSNAAIGANAMFHSTTGHENTASGYNALHENTTGNFNTANGAHTLYNNTTGIGNTAVGTTALFFNGTGSDNTAVGYNAFFNVTGSNNTAVGSRVGEGAFGTGSYNIFIGAKVYGVAGDANTLRIGKPFTAGEGQNRAFIAGIYGTSVANNRPVVIDANGQLGTINPQDGSGTPALLSATNQQQLLALEQKVKEQEARIARLEALLSARK